MELTSPKKRQKIETTSKKDHKIVIIGDSHARLWAQNVKSPIKGNFQVQGLIKPGAGVETLVTSVNSEIPSLTRKDVVIICGGANDVAKNNAKMALNQISNLVKSYNNTNIIVINLPHRFDLMHHSCVNNEIRSFNRNLKKN